MENLHLSHHWLIGIILGLLLYLPLLNLGQTPKGMNYQTVVRDQIGLVKNQSIQLRFTILARSTGNSVYQEIHSKTTNEYGLVNLIIGEGQLSIGNFDQIAWGGRFI